MAKPFASSADTADQPATVEELAEGVYAYTAQGDPNVGAIASDDSLLCVDARATPAVAAPWLAEVRARTQAPVEHLVLTHYHAVRALGAPAFRARHVVAHELTRRAVLERGAQDFESERRRFPRLFRDAEGVPGLTVPDIVFNDRLTFVLGEREVQLRHLGGGHTLGDAVVWLPAERILFAGDLVEAGAAPYLGDAAIRAWATSTLDHLLALDPEALVPGRGPVVRGREAVAEAVEATRAFLDATWNAVAAVRLTGGSLADAAAAARAALEPDFGGWLIFEHCFPFNVARAYDEAGGVAHPEIWTAERDAELWERLQAS